MICKNCSNTLSKTSKYCHDCGAKVITERITIKGILSDVSQNLFGWDNKFFISIKNLVLNPGLMLREYFDGARKKYINPFTFLAIGMAISLFVFNVFDNEFFKVMDEFNKAQLEWLAENLGGPLAEAEFQKQQLEQSAHSTRIMLKYFNLLSIIIMPFYTFLAFLVYRKPYNYGEHLVVNSYIQGFSFLSTTLVFFMSLIFHPAFYLLIYPLLILYYAYVYGKLYRLSIGQSFLKLLIFLVILFATFLVFVLAVAVIEILFGN